MVQVVYGIFLQCTSGTIRHFRHVTVLQWCSGIMVQVVYGIFLQCTSGTIRHFRQTTGLQ
jgi:hypothetical protein